MPAVQKHNEEQAAALYDFIDNSSFYNCPVAFEDRSLMNVVFVTGDEDLDKKFIAEAKTRGLVNLAGHRTVGGMRASIYNAMPDEGVKKLIDFMKKILKQTTDNLAEGSSKMYKIATLNKISPVGLSELTDRYQNHRRNGKSRRYRGQKPEYEKKWIFLKIFSVSPAQA